MSKFKIGDRVVIVKSPLPHMIGTITTVISDLVPSKCSRYAHSNDICWCSEGSPMLHKLNLPGDGPNYVAYPPDYIEKLIEDGNEKGEWTESLKDLCGLNKIKEPA